MVLHHHFVHDSAANVDFGIAQETDTGLAVSLSKTVTLGIAVETDTGLELTIVDNTIELGITQETDAALGLTVTKVKALGIATETDSGLALILPVFVDLGIASETDSAFGLVIVERVPTVGELRVRVIDRNGNSYGYVRTANVEKTVDPLNQLAYCDWSWSALDPTSAMLMERYDDDPARELVGSLHRELQVILDGTVILEGPMPRFEIGADGVCRGRIWSFSWWLHQRVVGRADRLNLLVNGGFEDDFDDWNTTGSPSISTADPEEGSKNAVLDAGDEVDQDFTFEHEYPIGLSPVFAVRVKVPTGSTLGSYGSKTDVLFVMDGPLGELVYDYEASDFPPDVWVEIVEPYSVLAPFTPHTVNLKLIGGAGGVEFDDVRSVQPESIGADFGGSDPALVLALLIEYMQLTANGKDALGIESDPTPTGGRTDVVWKGEDHETYPRCKQQLMEMTGGVDVWDRYPRTVAIAASRGSYKPGLKLVAGKNLVNWSVTVDGQEARNSVIGIGVGSGFTRNEGGYRVTNGLPVMELVGQIPKSTPLREYDLYAEELATSLQQPAEIVTGEAVWDLSMYGSIEPGDTLPVEVSVGTYSLATTTRVLSVTLDAARGKVLCEVGRVPG